jgi:tetratricopeptide (TPR) repeat protein
VTRLSFIVLLASAACATAAGKHAADAVRQADQGLPAATELPEGAERAALEAARAHETKGDGASGEAARAEWAQAAQGYAALAEKPGASGYRVPLRHRAAELFVRGQKWDRAAEVAGALLSDAASSDATKAMAARLAATAALGSASAQVKAGQLEKLDLGLNGARKERPVPAGWKRVVDAADAYFARAPADPDVRKPPAERRAGPSPAELALAGAEVLYSYGDLDGARKRFEAVLDRWSSEAEVLEQAIPLYLATFLAKGDRDGHEAAVDRLRERVGQEAARATGPRKDAFAKIQDGLFRARAGSRFSAAERLLADGKAAEAAKAFEAVAAEPGVGDPVNALHNGAVAWDRAGEPAKAAKIRQRILKDHPTAPIAAEDALSLAAYRSKSGDHLGAGRLYEEFLSRWPDSPNRCLALRNAASELDQAGRAAEAAARYVAFGGDEGCAKAAPDVAARALVRAGRLFEAQAKEAYGGAVAVPGVTDREAKGMVSEAKRRLRGL